MKTEYKNKLSGLIKIILLLYVILSSQSITSLLSKRYTEFIQSNRMIQHLICFITIFTLFTLFIDDMDLSEMLIYSIIGYLLFLLTTKVDIHLNLIILILGISLLVYLKFVDSKNEIVNTDKILSDFEKNKIVKGNNINTFIAFGGIIIVIIISVLLYSNKKTVQYGGGYDPIKFLFY